MACLGGAARRHEALEEDDEDQDDDDLEPYVILASDDTTGEILNKKSKSNKFLCALGFERPDSQHSHWRVPVILNKNKAIRILNQVLEEIKKRGENTEILVDNALDQITTEENKRRLRRKRREKQAKKKKNSEPDSEKNLSENMMSLFVPKTLSIF